MTLIETLRSKYKVKDSEKVSVISTTLIVKTLESDPYKFTARITTDAMDRQDEVVIPGGGMFGEFLQSGAIFWNHDYSEPVGYPDKTKQIVKGENFVEAGGIFMKRPSNYQGDFFPDFVREFVTQGMEAGINPGVSIGFIPVETRKPSKADIQKYGSQIQLVHSKWKLLEFSIAPVQANQEAVITAIGKGLIKRDVAKRVGIVVPDMPPAPIAQPQRIIKRCVIAIPAEKKREDLDAMAKRAVKRHIFREFGQIYMR